MQPASSFILEPVGLYVDKLPKPLSWPDLFGNDRVVEMEIGMGKGTFITEQAKARPEVNFFGLEWANWYWRYCSDRLRRNGCFNARTARAEAHFFLREYVRDATISVMHIYFPDPWPKSKQNKRRLIQPIFLEQVKRVLIPGGELRVVTDHKGYFEENIQPFVSNCGMPLIDYARPSSAGDDEMAGTNFERKYKKEGRATYAIAARKSAT